jgi:hypothetical protein
MRRGGRDHYGMVVSSSVPSTANQAGAWLGGGSVRTHLLCGDFAGTEKTANRN